MTSKHITLVMISIGHQLETMGLAMFAELLASISLENAHNTFFSVINQYGLSIMIDDLCHDEGETERRKVPLYI